MPDIVPVPKQEDGTIDKDKVKALYDASHYVEWGPFASSMGWDPVRSRTNYPSYQWVQEKKDRLAKIAAEKIAEGFFHQAHRWQEDIIRTLGQYPAAADMAFLVINAKLTKIINEERRNKGSDPSKWTFDDTSLAEVDKLASMLDKVQGTKYKSLMIDQAMVRIKDTVDKNAIAFSPQNVDTKTSEIVYEIMGVGEKVTGKQLEDIIRTYMDKPIQKAEPPPPVDPNED